MDRLSQMETLLRVVEAGSFTAAGRALGVGQPAVSKAIAALEARLGVALLYRGPAGMSLTDAGEDFVARARGILDLVDDAEASARGDDADLRGAIRMTTSTAFGRLKLTAPILEFMGRHPGVEVRLVLDDGDVDLVGAGLDLALRIGLLGDSALASRRVGASRRIVVAAPSYLAERGTPRRPADLARHECVIYTRLRRGRRWTFDGPDGPIDVEVRGRFHTDSSEAARAAVIAGFGVGYFPSWLCADALREGALVRLLPRSGAGMTPIHALFPERRLIARRTRALVQFLAERFAADPDLREA